MTVSINEARVNTLYDRHYATKFPAPLATSVEAKTTK